MLISDSSSWHQQGRHTSQAAFAPAAQPTAALCHSARFIPAFAQVLSTYESFAPESLDRLKAIDPACRIPTTVANDMAVHQVAVTGDLDLGLKAARAMTLGRAGPLDYAIHSGRPRCANRSPWRAGTSARIATCSTYGSTSRIVVRW